MLKFYNITLRQPTHAGQKRYINRHKRFFSVDQLLKNGGIMELAEEAILASGRKRFNDQETQLKKAGILGTIDTQLTKGSLPLVQDRIINALKEQELITRRPFWYYCLKNIPVETTAFIGLNYAFIGVGQHINVTNICVNIGRAISVELWAQDFKKSDPTLFNRLFKMAIKNHNSRRHRLKAISAVSQREGHGLDRWPSEKYLSVGQAVLNAVIAGSELFEVYNKPNRKHTSKMLGMTKMGNQLISELEGSIKWMSPVFKPMLKEPVPWKSFNTGCYHNKKLASLVPLIKHCSGLQKDLISNADMSKVYKALNAIQKTPFKINPVVYEQVSKAYQRGDLIPKFPRKKKLKIPGKVNNWEDLDNKERKRVKKNKEKVILRNRTIEADVVNMTTDLNIAEDLLQYDKFYLPHSLDFRGRVYPVPTFNHQRADYIRAMFMFAKGMRIGKAGIYWLAIHLANCGDFNKISKRSLEERVKWVEDNQRIIYCIGVKPGLTKHLWQDADKPFSFLAACAEFAGVMEEGEDFVSHLPVSLDGTNSGVQHYCAALRDKEGGASVNLTHTKDPQDVYQLVADNVINNINNDNTELSKAWLDYGVNRKTVKRNVMTFPYSSEKYGFRQQLIEDLMRPLEDKVLDGLIKVHPFGVDNGRSAATYMADKTWTAVNQVIKKAAEGMKFLQNCATEANRRNLPLQWTSPIGLPVVSMYQTWLVSRVRIFLYDKTIMPAQATKNSKINNRDEVYNCIMCNIRSAPTGVINKIKQRNGAAPNFIHSLDASHLMFTVLRAIEQGIEDFCLIHDSFGTHAANTQRWFNIIRDTFIEMYDEHDVFNDMGIKYNISAPDKGELDLNEVKISQYAFT